MGARGTRAAACTFSGIWGRAIMSNRGGESAVRSKRPRRRSGMLGPRGGRRPHPQPPALTSHRHATRAGATDTE